MSLVSRGAHVGFCSLLGVLVPVSESSSVFQSDILTPLKSAYLYEESKQSFRYTSAALVKNPALEEKVSPHVPTCISLNIKPNVMVNHKSICT